MPSTTLAAVAHSQARNERRTFAHAPRPSRQHGQSATLHYPEESHAPLRASQDAETWCAFAYGRWKKDDPPIGQGLQKLPWCILRMNSHTAPVCNFSFLSPGDINVQQQPSRPEPAHRQQRLPAQEPGQPAGRAKQRPIRQPPAGAERPFGIQRQSGKP